MKVVVLGLGYVGSVCAGCLSRDGFDVVGVDVSEPKVRQVQSGQSPVLEPGLDELIREGVGSGRLRAAVSLDEDSRNAEVFLVCVGTPSSSNGSSNLTHLQRVLEHVGEQLKGQQHFQVVTIRSTVPPGTLREIVIPLLEAKSGRRLSESLGVGMNPEFLRESTAIRDYDSAPFDLCGVSDERTVEQMRRLYASKNRPFHATSLETAELVKYVNNAFHALKVSFANEVGRLAKASGVDSLEVMKLLCEDRKLNISPAYLRPGMAFGGSCLPKDLRALLYEAKRRDVPAPLLASILASNETHLRAAVAKVLSYGRPRTALLGLSFKAGTDDLRESAMVLLAEGLLGKGIPLKIYDRNVRLSSLVGANRDYIEKEIPHIGSLLVETLPDALDDAEVVVIGSDDAEMDQVPDRLKDGQVLIDLFGRLVAKGGPRTQGICW